MTLIFFFVRVFNRIVNCVVKLKVCLEEILAMPTQGMSSIENFDEMQFDYLLSILIFLLLQQTLLIQALFSVINNLRSENIDMFFSRYKLLKMFFKTVLQIFYSTPLLFFASKKYLLWPSIFLFLSCFR